MLHAIVLATALAATNGQLYEMVGDNLVGNPGFEDPGDKAVPAGWGGIAAVYSRDTSVARSGEASLKYVNADPELYVLSGRRVDLKPGKKYEISAWVRAENVQGADSGATICAEFSDANGKYLGGCYPSGVKDTQDWKRVKGIVSQVPEKAARCTITCYVRKGMTGAAWWDDVSVRLIRERPLKTMLLTPNYRGEVTDAWPEHAVLAAFVDAEDYGLQLSQVKLRWRLVDAGSGVLNQGELAVDGELTKVEVPARSLAPGRYVIEAELLEAESGEVFGTSTERINRLAGKPQRTVTFDRHQRCIVDGQPFFPLGMYWSSIHEDQLDVYADSAFNCLMPYGSPNAEQMEMALARGLRVIYSVKDIYYGSRWCPKGINSEEDEYAFIRKKVETYKDHKALLAWYINDELSLDYLPRLEAHRQWIEDMDPNHPAWVVLYQVGAVRDYVGSFDVIGTDPYPIGRKGPEIAGQWTIQTREAVCGSRPVWQVPQAHDWGVYKKQEQDKYRAPTREEMRSMAWQCIAEGARGLVFYSWFDLRRDPRRPFEERWGDMKTVAAEIAEVAPILLSVEEPLDVTSRATEGLHWLVKRHEGSDYLFAVNALEKPIAAQFKLPRAMDVGRKTGGAYEPAGAVTTLDAALEPLAVHTYRLSAPKQR